jgi:succinate dehydrogenase / fumarate reductase cytochrome b subunit
MLGNLQVFEGAHALNGYAAFLRDMPILLWTVRVGLLSLVVLHIVLAIRLTLRNRRARPVSYAVRKYRQASFASRPMTASGLLLLLFIISHVLHLTVGVIDPSSADCLDIESIVMSMERSSMPFRIHSSWRSIWRVSWGWACI